MSILLAVVEKHPGNRTSEEVLKPMLQELSVGGERALFSLQLDGFSLYQAKLRPDEPDAFYQTDDGVRVSCLAGRVFGLDQGLALLRSEGVPVGEEATAPEFAHHSFLRDGDSAFRRFDGHFVFLSWDCRAKELVLANDTFGLHPVFLYEDDQRLLCCSEFQPLTCYERFDSNLDHEAIAEFFTVGKVLNDKTFYRNVKGLEPGTRLSMTEGRISTARYVSWDVEVDRGKPLAYFVERIGESFRRGIEARAGDPNVVECTLTGGFDTRFMLASMSEEARQSLSFVTKQSPFLTADTDKDIILARRLAEHLHLRHTTDLGVRAGEHGPALYDANRQKPAEKESLGGYLGSELLGGTFAYNSDEVPGPEEIGRAELLIRKKFSSAFFEALDGLKDLKAWSHALHDREETRSMELHYGLRHLPRSFLQGNAAFSGGWATAYGFFLGSWYSPFTYGPFLEELLVVPSHYLRDYHLYVEIMKTHCADLLHIPFASAGCTDDRVLQLRQGTYFSDARETPCNRLSRRCALKPTRWGRKHYRASAYLEGRVLSQLRPFLRDDGNAFLGPDRLFDIRFLDFEAWCRRYLEPDRA